MNKELYLEVNRYIVNNMPHLLSKEKLEKLVENIKELECQEQTKLNN